MIRRIPVRVGLLAALVCGVALGCGDGKSHQVSGKITFKGQPIPAGMIYFIPDESKGNSGPTGYADIKDGQYNTSAEGGQAITGGPVIIAIEGIDPNAKPDKADPSGEVTAKALFPRYETTADLPKSDSTKDFDVPAEAVKGTAQKGSAVIIP